MFRATSSFFKACIILLLLSSFSLSAQKSNHSPLPSCGTAAPTAEHYAYSRDVISQIPIPENMTTHFIPIQVHIVQDNGSGGPSLETLAKGLSNLNHHFAASGIQFFYRDFPNYVDNLDYYNFNAFDDDIDGNDTETELRGLFPRAFDAVNVYFCESVRTSSGGNACGYAYFPSSFEVRNTIVMDNDCMASPNGTYPHEFGHYFDLYHTHQGTQFGPENFNAENVARTGPNANCDTDGDLLCDTEADPRYDNTNFSNCSVPNDEFDAFGEVYVPPVENIMSYYPDGCGGHLTAGQATRSAQGAIERTSQTSYTLDATPQEVNVPENLMATFNEGSSRIELTWTDEADNEMGYYVERSTTSASEGFLALENVGFEPDVTLFEDADFNSNTTYWYRVRPVNGAADLFSEVAEVNIGVVYCGFGSNACDEYISRVEIGTIDNESECSGASGYTYFTNTNTNVDAGMEYSITVTNGNPYPLNQCAVYVDWNSDGDFDDDSESYSMEGSPGAGPYTGTVAVPNDAEDGVRRMRVILTYNTSPGDCGSYSFGEAEDYNLIVGDALPVRWLDFTAKPLQASNELKWSTAEEFNNLNFEIERWEPTSSNFLAIGRVEALSRHSLTSREYTFLDVRPLKGENIYRLRQNDVDGQFSYSNFVVVDRNKEGPTITVFPNPVRVGVLNVRTALDPADIDRVEVYDNLGRKLLLQMPVVSADGSFTLSLKELAGGVYFLKVSTKGVTASVKTKRFVVATKK